MSIEDDTPLDQVRWSGLSDQEKAGMIRLKVQTLDALEELTEARLIASRMKRSKARAAEDAAEVARQAVLTGNIGRLETLARALRGELPPRRRRFQPVHRQILLDLADYVERNGMPSQAKLVEYCGKTKGQVSAALSTAAITLRKIKRGPK